MSAPTINVNLKQCTCRSTTPYGPAQVGQCMHTCPGAPVPIPLSLEPFRSVTVQVRIAECSETCRQHMPNGQHTENCPGRPIRVSCSISGKTWEVSDVVDVEMYRDQNPGHIVFPSDMQRKALPICRERWALVKALLLGLKWEDAFVPHGQYVRATSIRLRDSLIEQRDALYAELAALARDEASTFNRQESAIKAMGEIYFLPNNFIRAESEQRASASILSRYVERLIEQVGELVQ